MISVIIIFLRKPIMNKLRELPKIDKLVEEERFSQLAKKLLLAIAKEKVDKLRNDLLSNKINDFSYEKLLEDIKARYEATLSSSLSPLINATGVILHTNMGGGVLFQKRFCKTLLRAFAIIPISNTMSPKVKEERGMSI